MIPSIKTDDPSLPTDGQTANSVATRASGNIPWTTCAIIVWPSEQDEKLLKCLLTKYKSNTLRALFLTKEELERFETFRLDHLLKDGNARHSEKDYPPPESYAQWNRANHAASPDFPILKRPTTREKAVAPEDGAESTKTAKVEGKGIKISTLQGVKFQIPLIRHTSSRDTNILPHQPRHKTLEDIDRESHLLLITPKQRPGRANQFVDTEQPINFKKALKHLERLDIPGGVEKVRGVGVIPGSPSSVHSEWEDEEGEEADISEVRVRKPHGRIGMRKKGTMAMPRNSIIDFTRRHHMQPLNIESRLLDEKSGCGLFQEKNDEEPGTGNSRLVKGFRAQQKEADEDDKDDNETDKFDKSTGSKRSFSHCHIPMPIPSGRPRNPAASRTTKRRIERPKSRLPIPRVSSTKPFAAAIDDIGRLPIEALLGLKGPATSEAPESSQPSKSITGTYKNWFTFPPIPSKPESQPSPISEQNTSTPSSLDLNDTLEKRMDSGFHLSSLPISQGKAKIEEGEAKSPLSGYPRRVKDADGLEREVQPPSSPRPRPSPRSISRGQHSRQIAPPTKLVRRTREPFPLAVTRRKEIRTSGSKAIAGGSLAGNLTIEGHDSSEEEREWNDLQAPCISQHLPPSTLRKNRNKADDLYPTFLPIPALTATAVEGEEMTTSLALRGNVEQRVAQQHATPSPVPPLIITAPEGETKTTGQHLGETLSHTSPSQKPAEHVQRRGVAERYPSFSAVAALATTDSRASSQLQVGTARHTSSLRQRMDLGKGGLDRRIAVGEIDDRSQRRLSRGNVRQETGRDVSGSDYAISRSSSKQPVPGGFVEREETDIPAAFEIYRRLFGVRRRNYGDGLSPNLNSTGARQEEVSVASRRMTTATVNTSMHDGENRLTQLTPSTFPKGVQRLHHRFAQLTTESQVTTCTKGLKANTTSTATPPGPTKSIDPPLKMLLEAEEPERHEDKNSDKDEEKAEKSAIDPSLAQKWQGTKGRFVANNVPCGCIPSPPSRTEDGYRVGEWTSPIVSAVDKATARNLEEEEQQHGGVPEQRSISRKARGRPGDKRHLLHQHDRIQPLPTLLAIQKHTLRPPFLLQYPDVSLAQEHLSAKWRYFASLTPRKNPVTRKTVEGPFLRVVFEDVPVWTVPMQRYLKRKKAEMEFALPLLQPTRLSREHTKSHLPVPPERRLQRDLSQSEINLIQRHREAMKRLTQPALQELGTERRMPTSTRNQDYRPRRGASQPVRKFDMSLSPVLQPRFELPKRPSVPTNAFEMPRTPPLPPSGLMVHDNGEWDTPSTIRNPSPGFPVLKRIERCPLRGGRDEQNECECDSHSLTREMETVFSNFSGIVRRPHLEHGESDFSSTHLPLRQSQHYHQRKYPTYILLDDGAAHQLNIPQSDATMRYHEELLRYHGRPEPRGSERRPKVLPPPVARGRSLRSFVIGEDHQWTRTGPLTFAQRSLGRRIKNACLIKRSPPGRRDAKMAWGGEERHEESARSVEAQTKQEREASELEKRLKRLRVKQKVRRVLLCESEDRD